MATMAPVVRPSEREMTFPTNVLTGIVLGLIGFWAGVQLGNGLGFRDDGNTGVILGYALGSILFLVGLGFANYPLQRLFGWRIASRPSGE
jgi:hypothetical protein